MDILTSAQNVFDTEIRALILTRNALDTTFTKIIELITSCTGKIVVTGIGKPGHIATKIAATFASLGTPSFYLHPAEAMHGDLGMIEEKDIVIAISYSGESNEITGIIPNIKLIGAKLIGITGNAESTLARYSDIVQVLPKFDEACYLGLAPTSSTTTELCYGDALAVVASEIRKFQNIDFGKFHPAGSLGKRLILKVGDLMAKGDDIPQVFEDAPLTEAITEMSKKELGMVAVVDRGKKLCGIITDGDLRRQLEKQVNIYAEKVTNIMTTNPKVIIKEELAVDALKYIKQNNINNLPVIDCGNHIVGIITWQMIIKAGIVA